jgi:hypothetical protein
MKRYRIPGLISKSPKFVVEVAVQFPGRNCNSKLKEAVRDQPELPSRRVNVTRPGGRGIDPDNMP